MTTATVPPLPAHATTTGFDDDGIRLLKADLGCGVVLWAQQSQDGQVTDIAAMIDAPNDWGHTADQLRALIPTLERAVDLAEKWEGK
ncbi:hypothetical protein MU0083_003384 [[Mycobacterium] kokjensenii]|uniref:Uncharacterized protein n=1 Tax=[Mycobacterium] kokjensenii TaxID=3064287 RepID=A0ABM9LT85_9MYCO|nr:hypothetical protein [Mycolicibacter sp. MU0083]CAJ1504229.1 hypothetical protein MU0083_003384 [Mycolicibacter sp. MU0083]